MSAPELAYAVLFPLAEPNIGDSTTMNEAPRIQTTASERGITLTELLVVLAIISALVVVIVPAFGEWLRAYKVRTAGQQVQGELRLARNVAVARNANVGVLFKAGEFTWTDAQGRQRRFVMPGGVTIANLAAPVSGDTVTIRNNGQIADPSKTLEIEGWVSGGVTHQWTVTFTASGKVDLQRTAP
jgi:prepilin-type N-terminal cleavage/methylation domain-containing protein